MGVTPHWLDGDSLTLNQSRLLYERNTNTTSGRQAGAIKHQSVKRDTETKSLNLLTEMMVVSEYDKLQ